MDEVFSALAGTLSSMSDGDFNRLLNGEYQGKFAEIKDDVNSTLTTLQGVVGELKPSIVEIQHSAENIANNNDQLAEGAQRQAAGLE